MGKATYEERINDIKYSINQLISISDGELEEVEEALYELKTSEFDKIENEVVVLSDTQNEDGMRTLVNSLLS